MGKEKKLRSSQDLNVCLPNSRSGQMLLPLSYQSSSIRAEIDTIQVLHGWISVFNWHPLCKIIILCFTNYKQLTNSWSFVWLLNAHFVNFTVYHGKSWSQEWFVNWYCMKVCKFSYRASEWLHKYRWWRKTRIESLTWLYKFCCNSNMPWGNQFSALTMQWVYNPWIT